MIHRIRKSALLLIASGMISCSSEETAVLHPIPDRLVVLTFDDGNKSDFTYVAPLLKQYEFGASFYVTEGLGYRADPHNERYLGWEEIRLLDEMGFEIGNHTATHPDMTKLSRAEVRTNLELIEKRCLQHNIPFPTTFVYPGWLHSLMVVEVLMEKGYLFARRGIQPEYEDPGYGHGARGWAYDPKIDHPLLIPTTGYAGPYWKFEDLVWAIDQAKNGKIAVLTYHGVPGLEHAWVSTEPEQFAREMEYLKKQNCTVIALRDLVKYVDPTKGPADPYEPIRRAMAK